MISLLIICMNHTWLPRVPQGYMKVSLAPGNAPKNTRPRTGYAFSVFGHLTRLGMNDIRFN